MKPRSEATFTGIGKRHLGAVRGRGFAQLADLRQVLLCGTPIEILLLGCKPIVYSGTADGRDRRTQSRLLGKAPPTSSAILRPTPGGRRAVSTGDFEKALVALLGKDLFRVTLNAGTVYQFDLECQDTNKGTLVDKVRWPLNPPCGQNIGSRLC